MGKLIIVPTPIGNLEDITLRAIRYLKECDLIYAEDTRVTRRLLSHLNIDKRTVAFHSHNEHRILDKCIETIEENEFTVLVSDAGTPGISDPGYLLVHACVSHGIEVECLPGPTAIIPALVASGFTCERFHFEGFLPHKKGRETRIKSISELTCTVVYYESPHRIVKTLTQLQKVLEEDRKACVVREISKIYETYHHGTLSELMTYFTENKPKGELVLIMEGKS
ncbi:MAG: 16S rRNA (cytidine(1402)-2'-O)-methyltransferase [Crocinitomicaceae bacterium]|jgi:16S rRNA (cytidine1402-2'-O)-methyltransferase|tara:strand:+ start:22497 stop:23168 length:672 start_codon:yes stop_codon:yes gene_type:complete